jgi:hypothetical protein
LLKLTCILMCNSLSLCVLWWRLTFVCRWGNSWKSRTVLAHDTTLAS